MNALHLTLTYFDPNSGVDQKIVTQVDALKNNGFKRVFRGMCDKKGWLRIDNLPVAKLQSISQISKRISFYSQLINYIKDNKITFVYFRFNSCSEPSMIWFFHKLKKFGVTSVMEIPTYPYEGELKKDRFYYLDKFTRRTLSKQMKRIVTFSSEKIIFGQKTINISNGVDFSKLPLRKIEKCDTFNVLGVANYRYWHGFDRLIIGLATYNRGENQPKVYFHIVSGKENEDISYLQELVKTYHLEEYVVFHGEMIGEELNNLFNKSQLAIGSLARHRNKIHSLKTLKNVEYAARGIPFVYSEYNEDFDEQPYVIKVKPDDSPIDISELMNKLRRIINKPEDIRKTVESLSWDNQIAKVIKEAYDT